MILHLLHFSEAFGEGRASYYMAGGRDPLR